MAESGLIELSYYDPKAQMWLVAYADTIILDHNEKGGVINQRHPIRRLPGGGAGFVRRYLRRRNH